MQVHIRRTLFVMSLMAVSSSALSAQTCLGVSTTRVFRSSIGFGAAFANGANGYYARFGADRGRVFGALVGGLVDSDYSRTKAKVAGVDVGTTITLATARRMQLCPFVQGRYERSDYRAESVAFQRTAPETLHESASLSAMDVIGPAVIRQSVLGGLSLSATFAPSPKYALVPFAGVGLEYTSLKGTSSHNTGVVHAGLAVGVGNAVSITPSVRTGAIGRNGETDTSFGIRMTFGAIQP
jgi:hypothetical protein